MRSKNSKAHTRSESEHIAAVKMCIRPGCSKRMIARGLCHMHYMRDRRAGLHEKVFVSDTQYLAERSVQAQNGCIEWIRATYAGYGKCRRNGRNMKAHVLSFEVSNGPVPIGLQVNHTCHNRACINPDHLYAGTQAQNMKDMRLAGRNRELRGADNGNSKITKEVAEMIRKSRDIARIDAAKCGVSISLVYAIRKGLIWKDLANAQ